MKLPRSFSRIAKSIYRKGTDYERNRVHAGHDKRRDKRQARATQAVAYIIKVIAKNADETSRKQGKEDKEGTWKRSE